MLSQIDWAAEARRIASMYTFDSPFQSMAFEGCVASCFNSIPPTGRSGIEGIPTWVKWAAIGFGIWYLMKRKE